MIIVNLDLVIPAVILQEMINIKSLNNYQNNSKAYLSTMTISVDQVMNYAIRMRAWDLDRVIVNFDRNDVINYLQHNADLFEQINHSSAYDKLDKCHHDFDNMVRKTDPSTGRDRWYYPWE